MIINGTTYHDETPRDLAEILERCRENGTPVLIRYGDRQTGRDWMEDGLYNSCLDEAHALEQSINRCMDRMGV